MRTSFLALLAELRRDGVTVLLATHRPNLLKAVDKVLVLRDGVVAQFGPAAEIGDQLQETAVPPRVQYVESCGGIMMTQKIRRTLGLGFALAFGLTLFIDVAILVVPIYDMQLYDRVLMSRSMDTVVVLSLACAVSA